MKKISEDFNLENSQHIDDVAYNIYRAEKLYNGKKCFKQVGFLLYGNYGEYYKKAESDIRKEKLEKINKNCAK